jgi:hypothetical protein
MLDDISVVMASSSILLIIGGLGVSLLIEVLCLTRTFQGETDAVNKLEGFSADGHSALGSSLSKCCPSLTTAVTTAGSLGA